MRLHCTAIALTLFVSGCGGAGSSGTAPLAAEQPPQADPANAAPLAPASEPTLFALSMLEGREVDERTFAQTFRALEVDAEPWVNAHLSNVDGNSGTRATFEARDRKTGELWTYEVSSDGSRSTRSLTRGSRKSSTPRRQ